MRLEQVLHGVQVMRRAGPQSAEVRSIEFDSRAVGKGALFVAMRGGSVDGSRFAATAVELGAVAVITDAAAAFDELARNFPRMSLVLVPHGRRALAAAAANLYNHPEEQVALTAVTGTNGKTTTTFLLDAMLRAGGRETVLVGTIECRVAGEARPSPHTTPESRDLLRLLAEGAARGATEAVMEVSSHALEQGRVHGLPFDVGIFTNLTRDHLDFHQTMAKYLAAKKALFDGSATGTPPRVAVVNVEDEYGLEMALAARQAGAELYSYGLGVGEFRAEEISVTPAGMRFVLRTPWGSRQVESRLTGRVNVQNMLAAAAAALARGLALEDVAGGAAELAHVPGRFQTVDRGQPFTVVVDYAHTDDALRNLLAVAREFVASSGADSKPGRVLTLFGCGGDRDRTKRPLMGRAAGEGSDLCMLTSDNPRGEDPRAILEDARPGLEASGSRYLVEPDRAAAIRALLNEARAGDIVLIAGKGHEKTQTIGGEQLPFDDVEVAGRALRELGWSE